MYYADDVWKRYIEAPIRQRYFAWSLCPIVDSMTLAVRDGQSNTGTFISSLHGQYEVQYRRFTTNRFLKPASSSSSWRD